VDELLKAALAAYGLEGARVELIRHNENLTYCIEDKYLLRIHRSMDGMDTNILHGELDPIALRRQELDYLQYLANHGMRVQTPFTNCQGALVTILPDGTAATLLTWLPGHTPGPEDARTEVFEAAGAMTARLHRLAAAYPRIDSRVYGADMCRRMDAVIAGSGLHKRHKEILLATSRAIAGALADAEDSFILLHGDLSSGNIVLTEAGPAPIDFSLMGYGHPMFDLAVLLASSPPPGMETEYFRAVIRGYVRAGGRMNYALLEHGYALSILSCIALHLNRWPQEDWFSSAMERWEKRYFLPLRQHRPLFPKEVYSAHETA